MSAYQSAADDLKRVMQNMIHNVVVDHKTVWFMQGETWQRGKTLGESDENGNVKVYSQVWTADGILLEVINCIPNLCVFYDSPLDKETDAMFKAMANIEV